MRQLTAFAAIVLSFAAVSAVSAQPVGIGTSPQGTLTYTLGSAYAKALQTSAGIQARVQPSTGTGVMVPLVETGELDIGFVNTLELTDAFTGTGSFAGRKLQNLRVVGV